MPKGQIIKALSGYYYVIDEQGTVRQCRARGLFKIQGVTPLVGDWVEYDPLGEREGYLMQVKPRLTQLVRPPIANVGKAALVFSLKKPELDLYMVDKFLVLAEQARIEPLICLTKADLLANSEQTDEIIRLYHSIGYPIFVTSIMDGRGIEELKGQLANTISVFAGPSGVGKSSLLNFIIPGLQLETGEISSKLRRGKHTTRHVELLALPEGGWVADTPGFSQLDFREIEKEELSGFFPEMAKLSAGCKFRGCLHMGEPGCEVLAAKENGEIADSRYRHYQQFLNELKEKKWR